MTCPTVSLCIIVGQESTHIERFLESFGPAFDELCMVRACGNQQHDNTVSLAKKWCDKNGKAFRFAEFINEDRTPALGFEAPVDDNDPATWRHVSDFAAARNRAWNLATSEWQFWADLDDVLTEGSAELIRLCTMEGMHDVFYFAYHIPQGIAAEHNMRERLFRRGISSWHGPVHENCHPKPGAKARACQELRVVFSHEPKGDKVRDPKRNERIMRYAVRYHSYYYTLCQECFYTWGKTRDRKDADEAIRWAEMAQLQPDLHPEMRAQMLLWLSHIHEDDVPHALELAWAAVRVNPWFRDGWARLGELEILGKQYQRACLFTAFMQSVPRPKGASGIPRSDRYHGIDGLTLRTRALRLDGDEERALQHERTMFEKNGKRFSLIHATRGRPEKAVETRNLFLRAAANPFSVEHIFAIDADDTSSIEALKGYRHVIVSEPNGCVKAWNAAAAVSSGHVLVQLSDDWCPAFGWDELMWLALEEEAQNRGGGVENTPLVLAVSDGHRKDALLCMAILTRARYLTQFDTPNFCQPYMFSPEYFGVYSDNEFSYRAFRDGIVVDARHIEMLHQHPVFEGKKPEEWDETHRRQNAQERYDQGRAVFERRNPDAVKVSA